ncbi:MAG TPA: hypothetical protein DCM86_07575 [Verrucomicrobiales bacterium]|jgi:hypothetical protein|nr:hypothetical protein [Verrucomicrobiales bacterium]
MNREDAARNLEIIRTLMERSAIYRRAQAPLMLLAGGVGVAAAGGAWFWEGSQTGHGFVVYWGAIACGVILGVLGLVRVQAIKAREPFWSPPCRRVVQAVVPGFLGGLAIALPAFRASISPWTAASLWIVLHGCALHSAGFFTIRGIRLFGLCLVVLGSLALTLPSAWNANLLMGAAFGGAHLAYGLYLRGTEPRTV